jgi:hypothetical protein
MGLMGALLIPHLDDAGHEVTWHDLDEPRVASWQASTGAIMPFGDRESMEGLALWMTMVKRSSTFRELYLKHVQRARFCYYSQNPPHGGAKFGVEEVAKVGGVRFSNMRSLHIDAQQIVQIARSHYRKARLPGRPTRADADELVVTHGWRTNVIGAYSWGWSAIVKADLSPEILKQLSALNDHTGCFYMRNGYQIAYLYPVGRTGGHYAGTTLITQKDGPKDSDPQPHFERWCKQIEEFSEGHLRVGDLLPDTLRQAWRPKPREDQESLVWRQGGAIFLRPAYGNGIRMFPHYLEALLDVLA